MNKTSLLGSIAAAALTVGVANGAQAQSADQVNVCGFTCQILKSLSAMIEGAPATNGGGIADRSSDEQKVASRVIHY